MVRKELLDILACPVCKSDLALKKGVKEPDSEFLVCTNCRKAYPVSEDIPIMLAEESRSEEEI